MEIIEKEVIKDSGKEYATKGKANTALGFGIAGTALAALNGGFNLFGNGNSKGCTLTCEDKVELTSAIFQGRITELQERFSDRQTLNQELFGLYKNQRDSFDILANRIGRLETAEAVNTATEPWKTKVLQQQIEAVAIASNNGINLEAERRCCADGKIVNYVNSNFYPIEVADVTVGSTSTPRIPYNPLCNPCNPHSM